MLENNEDLGLGRLRQPRMMTGEFDHHGYDNLILKLERKRWIRILGYKIEITIFETDSI